MASRVGRRALRLRDWYAGLPAREQSWVRFWMPMALAAVAVAASWWANHAVADGFARNHTTLLIAGVVDLTVPVVTILALYLHDRRWSVVMLGLTIHTLAHAPTLLLVLARLGPQPVPEWELDLIRSLYWVGGPLFLVGVVAWAARRLVGGDAPEPLLDEKRADLIEQNRILEEENRALRAALGQ